MSSSAGPRCGGLDRRVWPTYQATRGIWRARYAGRAVPILIAAGLLANSNEFGFSHHYKGPPAAPAQGSHPSGTPLIDRRRCRMRFLAAIRIIAMHPIALHRNMEAIVQSSLL